MTVLIINKTCVGKSTFLNTTPHDTTRHDSTELFKIFFLLLTLELLFCKKLVGREKIIVTNFKVVFYLFNNVCIFSNVLYDMTKLYCIILFSFTLSFTTTSVVFTVFKNKYCLSISINMVCLFPISTLWCYVEHSVRSVSYVIVSVNTSLLLYLMVRRLLPDCL